MGGEACPPELGARLVADGPRGLEHLRPHRGDRGRLRRPAGPARRRCGSGCRSTAGTSPSSTPPGSRSPDGADRRADHRRGRAGPLPRPGQGRREVRRRCRRSAGTRAYRSGDLVLLRRRRPALRAAAPTTRSSSAAGGSSSARSTARCSRLPGRRRRRGRRPAQPAPATSCWSATSPTDDGFDHARAVERLRELAAGGPGAAAGRGRRRCPTRTSGKVDRDALPWPLPTRRRRPRERAPLTATEAWVAELWLEVLGADVAAPARRLLRPRRRQPHRGPDGLPAAHPLPRGHRRRPLREPHGRRPWPHARRMQRPGRAHQPPGPPDPLEDPGRPGRLHASPLRAALRAALADLGGRSATTSLADALGLAFLPTVSWWWVLASAGWSWSPRRAG